MLRVDKYKLNKVIDNKSKKKWEFYDETLNSIQKSLDVLLKTKRKVFPRFYFLSNDELLEIISNSTDISAVEKNLKKCFDGINRIKYEGNLVQSIISPENEVIDLKKGVNTTGSVESWL